MREKARHFYQPTKGPVVKISRNENLKGEISLAEAFEGEQPVSAEASGRAVCERGRRPL